MPSSNQLPEIKVLSTDITWYQSLQKAIDQGTKDLPKDYIYKAQNIDRKYCGTSPTQQGPLEQCLRGFGNLLCLVVGQYGEVS